MKSLVNKLIREDNFLSLTGNVVIAILGIGGFAILARTLSKELFGEWVLFVAAASLLEMFRFGITSIGLIRFLSGANQQARKALIGANLTIGIVFSVLIALIVFGINWFFSDALADSGYALFFKYYPALVLVNLFWNNAICILQSDLSFGKILTIKSINSGLFFLCLLFHAFVTALTLDQLVYCLIAVNLVTSVFTFLKGWDELAALGQTTKSAINTLLNFGKYTTITLLGTNLLRNADSFIIGLSPLGPAAVALYSIPVKLTELQQIPLRSFAATAFPKMSKASGAGDLKKLKDLFYTYSGALTLLFALGSLVTFLFADLLVLILSGNQYAGIDPITGFNAADILRVFALYGLLLPIDRMTGIGLDSINKPKINALKVLVMLSFNIVGDLIAIFMFESLMMVACATILFTFIGIWLGFVFMDRAVDLSFRRIFTEGIKFYVQGWAQLKTRLGSKNVGPVNRELP